VVEISADGQPLRGAPVDVVAVGRSYVGLVATDEGPWFVTSPNGIDWRASRPVGLPDTPIARGAYPGGLNNVAHVLFVDKSRVYLRVQTGTNYNRLGATALYVSDATAKVWRPVVLPTPAEQGAFPITATTVGGRRFIGGAVYESVYGRDYLDAAVWVSDDDGGSWQRVDAPPLSGAGNQTIFTLAPFGGAVLAGGGDSSLLPDDGCCYYPDGVAFWRSGDGGEHWERAKVRGASYEPRDLGAAVGFVPDGPLLRADVSAYPPLSAQSSDGGRSWDIQKHDGAAEAVLYPRLSATLEHKGRFIATTVPTDVCTDCTQGAIALSQSGDRWRDVTPEFPCGTEGRTSYGFVSKPVAIGRTLAVLGGCGEQLSPFDETLLARSDDSGSHWTIKRYGSPTGGPMPSVAGNGTIVTLAVEIPVQPGDEIAPSGQIRAISVHRANS
jgi:hypothetical protein